MKRGFGLRKEARKGEWASFFKFPFCDPSLRSKDNEGLEELVVISGEMRIEERKG